MSDFIDRLDLARQQLANCEHDLRRAEWDLEVTELTLRHELVQSVNGDYKLLGPNEHAQKAEINYRVQTDERYKAGREQVLLIQHAVDYARVHVDSLTDERRDQEYHMRFDYVNWLMQEEA